MISEIFEFFYTTDIYPTRLYPLSREELCRGMSEEAADKYLSLVKELYNECYFDVNAKFKLTTPEEQQRKNTKKVIIYDDLIKHLFKKDAISDEVYVELYQTMAVDFNFIERPDNPNLFVSDSLDDFRLAFEYSIIECDSYFNMTDQYLMDRYGYGVCVHPSTLSGIVTGADLYIYRCEETQQLPYKEISYWEAYQLLVKIQNDMKQNSDEQKRLDSDFCKVVRHQSSNIPSLQKTAYKVPKNIAEWYTIKRALEFEAENLLRVEDKINRTFKTMEKPANTVGNGASLYIYKGRIVCHQQNHPIVPATAILHDEFDNEIQIDVEYCQNCNRYMLNYVSFEHYREKHSVLIGKLKMVSSSGFSGEFDLAPESPLKLCGYSVSQTDGLSSVSRQFILAKIIHDGIMSKTDVIHYIEHFINMNGSKEENALAVEKWNNDLAFVHKYDISIQPKEYINAIKKY